MNLDWKIGKDWRASFISHHHIEGSSSLSNIRSKACKRSFPASWESCKSETLHSELKDDQELLKRLLLAFWIRGHVEFQSKKQRHTVQRPSWVAFAHSNGSLGQISEGLFKRLYIDQRSQRSLQYFWRSKPQESHKAVTRKLLLLNSEYASFVFLQGFLCSEMLFTGL